MVPAAAPLSVNTVALAILFSLLIVLSFTLAMRLSDIRAERDYARINVRYLLSVLRDRNDLVARLLEGGGVPPELVQHYRETFDKELDVVRKQTGSRGSRPPVE